MAVLLDVFRSAAARGVVVHLHSTATLTKVLGGEGRGFRVGVFGVRERLIDDAAYILETIPIVKRKDVAAHGEYRTKRLILEAYDAMAEAIRTGTPYQSPFLEGATA